MLYILDTANISEIRELIEYYPIDGVTTNPSIIANEKCDFSTLIKDIRDIISNDRMLHIQTISLKAEGMVKEAMALKEYVKGNFYAKIPTCQEGIKAMGILKRMGIKVTATAIFTQQQALLAAKAGADFVAPYVNRLDNISSDGVGVVSDIVRLIHMHQLDARVLAASFKNVEQVQRVSMSGAQAVTLNPELLKTMLYHPLTDRSINDFISDWKSVYGENTGINDVLNLKNIGKVS